MLCAAWKGWAEDNGHGAGNKQTFGRNLRAAYPAIRVAQPRDGEERTRVYYGITLKVLSEGSL